MVNPIGKNQERKRSVTFEAADVASLHQPEVKVKEYFEPDFSPP